MKNYNRIGNSGAMPFHWRNFFIIAIGIRLTSSDKLSAFDRDCDAPRLRTSAMISCG
jgi:hypothetical protein